MVEILIDSGADMGKLNNDGKTASEIAETWGYKEILELLNSAEKRRNFIRLGQNYPQTFSRPSQE